MTWRTHALILGTIASVTAAAQAGDTHIGAVTDISVDRSKQKIYCCSQGGIFSGLGDSLKLELRPDFRVVALTAHKVTGLQFAGGDPGVSGAVGRLRQGTKVTVPQITDDMVAAIASSLDGRLTAVACTNGDVLVLSSGKAFAANNWTRRHHHTAAARAVAFSPDGKWLASAGLDGLIILSPAWPEDDAKPIHLDDHTAGVECLTFSPDSSTLASGSRDSKVRLHQTNGNLLRSYDALGMADEPVAGRVASRVLSIAWGKQALVAGTSKGTLHLLSQTDDQVTDLEWQASEPITALAIGLTEAQLLVGTSSLARIELEPPSASD